MMWTALCVTFEDDNGPKETLHHYSSINNTLTPSLTKPAQRDPQKRTFTTEASVEQSAVFTVNIFPIGLQSHAEDPHKLQQKNLIPIRRSWNFTNSDSENKTQVNSDKCDQGSVFETNLKSVYHLNTPTLAASCFLSNQSQASTAYTPLALSLWWWK